MLKHYTLQTRQQEIRYQGYFESFAACLESALQNNIDCTFLNLRDSNLSQANLDGGNFTSCDFTSAHLNGTNMSECILSNALFSNAVFSDVCLCESLIEDCLFFETSFSGTDIANCILKNSLFSCPSFFSINIHDVREISGCRYYHDGEYCAINAQPVILSGLPQRLILLDSHIMLGNKLYKRENGTLAAEMKAYKNIISALSQAKKGLLTCSKERIDDSFA
jgi:hypothetical protein